MRMHHVVRVLSSVPRGTSDSADVDAGLACIIGFFAC